MTMTTTPTMTTTKLRMTNTTSLSSLMTPQVTEKTHLTHVHILKKAYVCFVTAITTRDVEVELKRAAGLAASTFMDGILAQLLMKYSSFPIQRNSRGQGKTKSCPPFQKKLFHRSGEKMQEKMKMILQNDENLVHIQQQYSVYFCEKIDSKSGFFKQIWRYSCLIIMILIRTNYLGNSLRDSSLSQYSIAKILFIPGSLDNLDAF